VLSTLIAIVALSLSGFATEAAGMSAFIYVRADVLAKWRSNGRAVLLRITSQAPVITPQNVGHRGFRHHRFGNAGRR